VKGDEQTAAERHSCFEALQHIQLHVMKCAHNIVIIIIPAITCMSFTHIEISQCCPD
jgi:hypothetical protein